MTGVSAIFTDQASAAAAAAQLREAGVPSSTISLRPRDQSEDTPIWRVTGAHRIAFQAGLTCAVIGLALGTLVGLGLLTHPLLGFLGPGALGGALKGTIGGAGFGTLFGYILGLGLWDDDGERAVGQEAHVILSVRHPPPTLAVEALLQGAGGQLIMNTE